MKLLIVTFMFFTSPVFANQVEIECEATAILDATFLEESFSVEEYPSVTVEQDSFGFRNVYLGMAKFEEEDEDIITVSNSTGFNKSYKIVHSNGLEEYKIFIFGSPLQREGKVYGQRVDEITGEMGPETLIATLSCN
ncbi:MAG: hypothetical protein H6620_05795 [Halobacteriovoraceae bacterium]|nr:hypothetical protein [Halobacteriovoraceae bacterium]